MSANLLKCPNCDINLAHYEALGIALDGCATGCGGIWFDKGELQKFEDLNERPPFEILRLKKNAESIINLAGDRSCPRCIHHGNESALETRLAERTLGVEVDTCPTCAGTWLDLGELKLIRADRAQIDKMEKVIVEMEKKGSGDPAFWPRGLKAVLRLIFSTP